MIWEMFGGPKKRPALGSSEAYGLGAVPPLSSWWTHLCCPSVSSFLSDCPAGSKARASLWVMLCFQLVVGRRLGVSRLEEHLEVPTQGH